MNSDIVRTNYDCDDYLTAHYYEMTSVRLARFNLALTFASGANATAQLYLTGATQRTHYIFVSKCRMPGAELLALANEFFANYDGAYEVRRVENSQRIIVELS